MGIQTSRRGFLAAGAAAALVVGFSPKGLLAAGNAETLEINPFVTIAADGEVTVIVKHFEMGQGTSTGLPTLVAEELDADWQQVKVAFAPSDNSRYANLLLGAQGTGGSTAMANSFLQYRKAGAAARELLVRAAAEAWGVDPAEVEVEEGVVSAGTRRVGFGTLIAAAGKLSPVAEPTLKDPGRFRLIGRQHLPRKDSSDKTDGRAIFALDVKVPGMVTAVIKRPPRFGAKLTSFDAGAAQEIAGFLDAKALPNGAGVAVFAKSTWPAIQARDLVSAEWDFSAAEMRGSDQLMEDHLALLDQPQHLARPGSDFAATAAAIEAADKVVEAEFRFPFLAHASMEPLNCVIQPTETGVKFIDGSQFAGITHPTVAAVLGLQMDQVEIETVYAGGSFGRRATPSSDYQVEAAMAFALLGGTIPVKLVWTREDDLAGGHYRPMAAHRARLGLDAEGGILGWDHRVAVKSILKGSPFEQVMMQDGIDATSVEGVNDSHYAIPGFSVGLSDAETAVPVLWWRSVGHTHTAYAMEVMMDLAAEAAGQDPLAYRLNLLSGGDKDSRRLAGVLSLAAEKAGWGEPLPEGRGRGLAVHKSFGSYVAEVVEVALEGEAVRIAKVTCAVDCGLAVNPDVIKAQMEGGIGYGLGAVMRNEITLSEGEVEQWNFPDYEPLRITDIGSIEVHIVASEESPSGVGEPGVPPAGPALANAIRSATGIVVTQLPMTRAGITFA